MTNTYDAIIIGTGQAGPFLAQRLAGAGMKVAIIERKLFGGTCVNTGCTPTKTMIASAYAAHMVRRAADFGVVNNGSASVDMKLRQIEEGRDFGAVENRRRELAERHDELHGVSGTRSLRVPERSKRRLREAHGGSDIHQRGRSRSGASDARYRRSPIPYQQLHHGRRLSSASPGHHRRRLHRPGIRANVPQVWE